MLRTGNDGNAPFQVHPGNRTNIPTFFRQGQILTPQQLGIKPGARFDTRQPGAPQHIGIQSTC